MKVRLIARRIRNLLFRYISTTREHSFFERIFAQRSKRPSCTAPNAVDIKSNHLSIGTICELWITGAMIEVPMGMNDKQSRLCGSISRKQAHHRVCQRNNFWICNIACVDQKRLR
jgi:hypothetical protein